MTPTRALLQPWICADCKQPIPAGDGIVQIYNTNPTEGTVGGYPVIPSRSAYDPELPGEPKFEDLKPQHVKDYIETYMLPEPNIGFRAIHRDCLGDDRGAYWFVAPAAIDEYLAWVLHLEEKVWMGRHDLMRMLRFWYSGHGLEAPTVP